MLASIQHVVYCNYFFPEFLSSQSLFFHEVFSIFNILSQKPKDKVLKVKSSPPSSYLFHHGRNHLIVSVRYGKSLETLHIAYVFWDLVLQY